MFEFVLSDKDMKEERLGDPDSDVGAVDRVVLDMEMKTQEDEEKLREVIADLRDRGIECLDKTSLFRNDVNTVDLKGEYDVATAFQNDSVFRVKPLSVCGFVCVRRRGHTVERRKGGEGDLPQLPICRRHPLSKHQHKFTEAC